MFTFFILVKKISESNFQLLEASDVNQLYNNVMSFTQWIYYHNIKQLIYKTKLYY